IICAFREDSMPRQVLRNGVLFVTVSVLAGTIALRAQRGGGGGAAAPVPLTARSLLSHPELYPDKNLSLRGAIEKVVSKTVFTVDQDPKKAAMVDLLVIAPGLLGAPVPNTYVDIVGDTAKFDPATVSQRLKGYTLDMPADLIEKYRGKPVLFAT